MINELSKRVELTMLRRKRYHDKIGSAAAALKRCSKWCAFALKLQHGSGKYFQHSRDAWQQARHEFKNGIHG